MKDKSKIYAIILTVLVIIVLIISFVSSNEKNNTNDKLLIVTNYSEFYTVNSCLYRTMTLISSKDKDNLMLLLNQKYKKDNNITQNNILTLFSEIPENSTFVSREMYYQKISDTLVKYYVKGYIEKNQIYDDENIEITNDEYVYFIVYLDSSRSIFSIEPYDGKLFRMGDGNGI